MTQETVLIILVGIIALLTKHFHLSESLIKKCRLRPLAIIILVAAAITPTPDMLTCILLTAMLFPLYLIAEFAISRIRHRTQQP